MLVITIHHPVWSIARREGNEYDQPILDLLEKNYIPVISTIASDNSGAEANECAIKVARKYSAGKKGSDCYTILTLENSFRGRTLTTLAATGQETFHRLFQPLTPGFVHIEANNVEALRQATEKFNLAGIMLECVQGEGDVNPLTPEFSLRSAFVKTKWFGAERWRGRCGQYCQISVRISTSGYW